MSDSSPKSLPGVVCPQIDQPPRTVPVVKLLFAAPLGEPLHFVPATPPRSEVAGSPRGREADSRVIRVASPYCSAASTAQ